MTDPIRSALKRLLSAVLDGPGQDDHPMGWARVDDAIDAARAALSQPGPEVGPTDEELLDIAAQSIEPYDKIRPGEYEAENNCAIEVYSSELIAFARAVLARFAHQPTPPAEGEVGELVEWLRDRAESTSLAHNALRITRAADLLEQRHPTPVSVGMIPVEYWDIDSGARIVTEPSEEAPGGCWVVLNSRHVNPLTEFPTAKAAWNALQQAHALPLPAGEVE